jgi:hypothetical protein
LKALPQAVRPSQHAGDRDRHGKDKFVPAPLPTLRPTAAKLPVKMILIIDLEEV